MRISGVSLPHISTLTSEGLVDFARFIESAGFPALFTTEAQAWDGFTVLAHVAAATTRIRLGAGILPIYTRTPTVMAQSWASLDALSGGRAIVGLGVSSPAIVERWNGVPLDKPLARMREYVEILRAIFAGGRVDHKGACYHIERFRPGVTPVQTPLPIYLAALNPKMLRLAGEIADGVLINLTPAGELPVSIAEIEKGIARSGRTRKDVHIALMLRACVCDDRTAANFSAQQQVLGYALAPQYRLMFERHGFAAECAAIHEKWNAKDQMGAFASVSEPMLDALFAIGDADKVRADIERFLDAGIDSVQIQPIIPLQSATGEWEQAKATLRALAPE